MLMYVRRGEKEIPTRKRYHMLQGTNIRNNNQGYFSALRLFAAMRIITVSDSSCVADRFSPETNSVKADSSASETL